MEGGGATEHVDCTGTERQKLGGGSRTERGGGTERSLKESCVGKKRRGRFWSEGTALVYGARTDL